MCKDTVVEGNDSLINSYEFLLVSVMDSVRQS